MVYAHRIPRLSIHDLINDGWNARTIRYYISVGAVPPPYGGRGRNAWYGPAHLDALRAIREAKDARVTLADLRERRTVAHGAD